MENHIPYNDIHMTFNTKIFILHKKKHKNNNESIKLQ